MIQQSTWVFTDLENLTGSNDMSFPTLPHHYTLNLSCGDKLERCEVIAVFNEILFAVPSLKLLKRMLINDTYDIFCPQNIGTCTFVNIYSISGSRE